MFLMDYKTKSLFANCRRTLKSMGKLEIVAHSTLLLAIIVFLVFAVFTDWKESDLDTTADTQKIGEVQLFEEWEKYVGLVEQALTPSYPYCIQSMPFYKTLQKTLKGSQVNGRFAFMAVIDTSQSRRLQERVLAKYQVRVDTLMVIPVSDYNVEYVPTILIVDGEGRVQHKWIGMLDAKQESQIEQLFIDNTLFR